MFTRLSAAFAVLAFVSAGLAPATAAGPLAITTKMLVEKRVAAGDGSVRMELAAPAKVVPGDRITVVLSYRNVGMRSIADLVLANPVPRGMAFRAAGSGSPAPELSVDGRSFASLAALRVQAADGTARPATVADVTQVRWRLATPVAPGQGGELTFQAVLK